MLKKIFFISSLFTVSFSPVYGSDYGLDEVTHEELMIFCSKIPPSLLTKDGELRGPPHVREYYLRQAQKAIEEYRQEREAIASGEAYPQPMLDSTSPLTGAALIDTALGEDWQKFMLDSTLVFEDAALEGTAQDSPLVGTALVGSASEVTWRGCNPRFAKTPQEVIPQEDLQSSAPLFAGSVPGETALEEVCRNYSISFKKAVEEVIPQEDLQSPTPICASKVDEAMNQERDWQDCTTFFDGSALGESVPQEIFHNYPISFEKAINKTEEAPPSSTPLSAVAIDEAIGEAIDGEKAWQEFKFLVAPPDDAVVNGEDWRKLPPLFGGIAPRSIDHRSIEPHYNLRRRESNPAQSVLPSLGDESSLKSKKRKKGAAVRKPRKKKRSAPKKTNMKIREEHYIFLEKLLSSADKIDQQTSFFAIYNNFVKEFQFLERNSLRKHIFIAIYSLELLDVVKLPRSRKFSKEIERFTYNLVKKAMVSKVYCRASDVHAILSKEYPGVDFGSLDSMSFYVGAMKEGFRRQFARKRRAFS